MQVVVNARFLTQPLTGVQRFAAEIAKQLKAISPAIKFFCPPGVLDGATAKILEAEVVGRLRGHAWEQIELPYRLKTMGSPLLINLANAAPVFYKNKVSTIHDVAVERFPKSFSPAFRLYYRKLIPRVVASSRLICTVSEFSKSEISSVYNVQKDKIFVVNNAVSENFAKCTGDPPDQPFILAVSSISHQKNFSRLVEAFLKIKDRSHILCIVGDLGRSFANPGLAASIENNSRIRFLGRVSDADLARLYSDATAFIYPSLYEGFGIPPLEAQACGCPVVVSSAASISEVCRDTALYFDPYNVLDIADKIDLIINDEALRSELSRRGYKNVERFSWQDAALKFYNEIKGLN